MHRILFIGNSHTYLHYMPQLLTGLAAGSGKKVITEQSIGEGASVAWHWSRPETKDLIANGSWTHVVLQERSRGPLEDKPSMHTHARHLDRIIRKAGARTVFFMTWAARANGGDQAVIASAYKEIARVCDAMLAPVGKAWDAIMNQHASLDLYHRDGRHAGKAGAYLSACVFYTLLCEESPVGLSHVIEKEGRLLADLPEKDAMLLQEAARAAVAGHGIS